MARKQKPPQTELGKRFREIRRVLGFKERKDLADHLGISASTLASYETGLSEPKILSLIVYKNIGISLDWLATGEGEMFDKKARLQTEQEINAADLQEAVRLVEKLPVEIKLSADKKAELIKLAAAMLKNEQDIEPLKRVINILRVQ